MEFEAFVQLMRRHKVKHAKFDSGGGGKEPYFSYDVELDASAFSEVAPTEIVPEKMPTKEETVKAAHRDLFWSGAYDPDEKIEV